MKRKNNNTCVNCGKYKVGHIISWKRKDGRIGRQYKIDDTHDVCSKCWRAYENKVRSLYENNQDQL